MRGDQSEAGDPEEKAEDVQLIAEFMIRNGYCTAETLPQTVIAWDLVRIANLGRWHSMPVISPRRRCGR